MKEKENNEAKVNFNSKIENFILNRAISQMQQNKKERARMKLMLEIFNEHGISTDEFLLIMGEVEERTKQILAEYEDEEEVW